jgi:hypothetical protein
MVTGGISAKTDQKISEKADQKISEKLTSKSGSMI